MFSRALSSMNKSNVKVILDEFYPGLKEKRSAELSFFSIGNQKCHRVESE